MPVFTDNSTSVEADPAWAAENNASWIIALATIFQMVALATVALRLYCRAWVLRTAGKDDWVMLSSAICNFGGYICILVMTNYGLGRHEKTLTTYDVMMFNKVSWIQNVVAFTLSIGLLKISIGLNLLRIGGGTSTWYHWCNWIVIAYVVEYTVQGVIGWAVMCQPLQAYWDPSITDYVCESQATFKILACLNTASAIATDVSFSMLPLPLVWNLQMNRRARIYLVAVLSLGYISVIMGAVKTYYQVTFSSSTDITTTNDVMLWAFLQLNTGTIAACAPSLKPMLRIFHQKSSLRQQGYSNGEYFPPTIGARAFRGPIRRSLTGYELEDGTMICDDEFNPAGKGKTATHVTSSFRSDNTAACSSEETAHENSGGERGEHGGIMMTTQVTVGYH